MWFGNGIFEKEFKMGSVQTTETIIMKGYVCYSVIKNKPFNHDFVLNYGTRITEHMHVHLCSVGKEGQNDGK